MGHREKTCENCQELEERLKEADQLLMKYKLKMDEAAGLLVMQNREIHDLKDLLKPPVSIQKH